MKFTVSSKSALDLCTLIHHLATIASIISLKPTSNFLHIQGMDCCQICLFDCKLAPAWFGAYDCGEAGVVHVNAKILSMIFRMVGSDQTASVSLGDESMSIVFEGSPVADMHAPIEEFKSSQKQKSTEMTTVHKKQLADLQEKHTTAESVLQSKQEQEIRMIATSEPDVGALDKESIKMSKARARHATALTKLRSKHAASIDKLLLKQQTADESLKSKQTKHLSEFTSKLQNRITDTCRKQFEIPLVALDYDFMDVISILEEESSVELCMTSKKFAELVGQFELFDEILSFTLSEEAMKLSATGEHGSMSAELDLEGGHLLEFSIEESLVLHQSFSHRFVKNLTAFNSIAEECSLLFFKERPMFITYEMGPESRLVIMLAPRVD